LKEGNPMARRYTLDTKINALNWLDTLDGDLKITSVNLDIPISTLSRWQSKESELRQDHRQKLQRQFTRLKAELQVQMLDRGMKIVACMDDETLDKAPLNQLATALGSLVNHALKLDEAGEEPDEQTEEKIIRFEFLSDGRITETPPWTEDNITESSPIQDRGMRETLGKNGARENHVNGRSKISGDAWLVARPDLPDVESGLAGFEDEFEERDWYHD
jgi:hypothetical protein